MNDGVINLAPINPNNSSMVNPLSARTASPEPINFMYPDFFTISISLVLPPKAYDKKFIVPCGVMEIKNFTVL